MKPNIYTYTVKIRTYDSDDPLGLEQEIEYAIKHNSTSIGEGVEVKLKKAKQNGRDVIGYYKEKTTFCKACGGDGWDDELDDGCTVCDETGLV